MLCVTLFGMELAIDFTAPALLALLSLYLPQKAFFHMCAACLLHESAHLLMMRLLGVSPERLRISAAGMQLSLKSDALCPLLPLAAILLAGAGANLIAALCMFAQGEWEGAGAQLSLALFNLLPYRSTDGGTLLCALLEPRCITKEPAKLRRIMRCLSTAATLLLAAAMLACRCRNLSLWSMLVFMTAAEWLQA